MRNCQFCHTELQKGARFCHHCGAKAKQATRACSHCQHENSEEAQFCANCGSGFMEIPVVAEYEAPEEKIVYDDYEAIYPLDFRNIKGLGEKIRQYFVVALGERIQEVHNPSDTEAYMNHLMRSDFQEIFKLRTDQLAEEAYTIHSKQGLHTERDIDRLLDNAFDGLLNFFLIKHCQHINEFKIPEATLKYEGARIGEINLQQLMLDYLQLEDEDLVVYTDFLKMPLAKLQNAGRYYLFPSKDEKILLICDQTVFGSCKEGFALTEAALYWKAHFKPAQKVYYKDLQSIQKKGDHLLINGLFFNGGGEVNGKMVYLLRQLGRMI